MATIPTAMLTTMSPGTASRSLTILNPPVSENRHHKKYPPKIGALKSKLSIRSRVYFELLPWPWSNKMSRRRQRSADFGRSFGRKVTLRWSMKLMTPPGFA